MGRSRVSGRHRRHERHQLGLKIVLAAELRVSLACGNTALGTLRRYGGTVRTIDRYGGGVVSRRFSSSFKRSSMLIEFHVFVVGER